MGQGTDSCGGYEVEFDEFEEALAHNKWPTRNGGEIKLSDMTLSHIKGAKRYCQIRAQGCNFSADADEWRDRADMFDNMIDRFVSKAPKPIVTGVKAPIRGSTVTMVCHCTQEYKAREADLKRGWGLSCSKRCASIRREFGRPAAKRKK